MAVGRRVLPNGRSAPVRDPYASIRADLISAASYRALPGSVMRLHLLFEANYNPNHELIMPCNNAAKQLKASCSTVTAGIASLVRSGIVAKVRDGRRPNTMGILAKGKAAVYALPHRQPAPASPPVWKQPHDPRPQGYWRVHVQRLRQLVRELSDNEAKVYLIFHAADRTAEGSLVQNDPRALSEAETRIPKTTLHRVIKALITRGRIEVAQPAAGSRPALYRLAPSELKVPRQAREKSRTTK